MSESSSMFKMYDVRGIVGKDLNPDVAELIGKAFGTYLLERGTKDVVVGRDSRETSPEYLERVINGLKSTGCDVVNIGLTLSSAVYFTMREKGIKGGLMVTASHNPPTYNGFKFCHGKHAIAGDEIQEVRKLFESGKFKTGEGSVRNEDMNKVYFDRIAGKVKIEKRLKVVVDCGNSTPGALVPGFLEQLGCDVIPLFCDLDPSFPNHAPDPAGLVNYHELVKMVKKTGADIGIMLDGDGDRAGFVDHKGGIHLGDTILTLFIREIIPKNPGRKVIVELKDSEVVVEETKRLGGIPIFWKTGHALLDKKIQEEDAILCGEMSCHYWVIDDWYSFDDSIYAMARLLRMASQRPLAELVDELPKYPATPEYRLVCPDEKKDEVVEGFVRHAKEHCDKVIDVDGVRAYIADGWFLLRQSNTQPRITMRCEAKTTEGLEKVKDFVKKKMDEYDFITLDWDKPYH